MTDKRDYTFSSIVAHVIFTISILLQSSESGIIKIDTESSVWHPHNSSSYSVYLTVSSKVTQSNQDRLLEMNWENLPEDMLDSEAVWVQLYDSDPMGNTSSPLVAVKPSSKGYFRTSLRFPQQIFTNSKLTDECLGFWVALTQNDKVVSSSCLRAHPHWMSNNRQAIGNLSLLEIMIPGTHNAGSYASFDPNDDSIFNRYMYTQEESTWNQLVYGIRYLDLRVAYQKVGGSDERFWITHSNFRTQTTLIDVIRHVKVFLNVTNEIVIMDFHRFVTGFTNRRTARQRHTELVDILEEQLGEYMVPIEFSSWSTLNQLWDTNKRLYVGYADDRSRRQSAHLFPAIRQLWGDVDTVDNLKTYLNSKACDTRNRLSSAMAQLTPKTAGVLFDTYGGLRKMAEQVNRRVTKWYRDEWIDCANIVATDFFLGNNIIDLAIETNKNKFLRFKK